ncbi:MULTISPECIES: hypothetical protein [Streptomyces]|uniref:hypothetical protein n=1 Tax=Streptomyces TaxID=1883 RepID=UPI0018D4A3B6|nr:MULTISPECIES: hypothetical protein [Streptomyces]
MRHETAVALLARVGLVEVDAVGVPGDRAVAEQLKGRDRVLEPWECVPDLIIDGHYNSCKLKKAVAVLGARYGLNHA